jgi:hypothetical protein
MGENLAHLLIIQYSLVYPLPRQQGVEVRVYSSFKKSNMTKILA